MDLVRERYSSPSEKNIGQGDGVFLFLRAKFKETKKPTLYNGKLKECSV